jgi:hypothetical protein
MISCLAKMSPAFPKNSESQKPGSLAVRVERAVAQWICKGELSEGAAGGAPSAGVLSLGFDRYLGHRHRRGSIRWRLRTAAAALVEAGLGNSPRWLLYPRCVGWLPDRKAFLLQKVNSTKTRKKSSTN